MITSIISVVTCYQPYKNFKVKQVRYAIQVKTITSKSLYLVLKLATYEHKGARALAICDSNVSKWCLRARSGRWEYEREKHSFYVENSIY